MTASPTASFAIVPRVASAVPGTADTPPLLNPPTNQVAVITGVAAGTKIERVVLQGLDTTVAGLVNLFLYDGTTYHAFDVLPVLAVNVSATVAPYRFERPYEDLVLPSNIWSLRASQSIAGNASKIRVIAMGADLT